MLARVASLRKLQYEEVDRMRRRVVDDQLCATVAIACVLPQLTRSAGLRTDFSNPNRLDVLGVGAVHLNYLINLLCDPCRLGAAARGTDRSGVHGYRRRLPRCASWIEDHRYANSSAGRAVHCPAVRGIEVVAMIRPVCVPRHGECLSCGDEQGKSGD